MFKKVSKHVHKLINTYHLTSNITCEEIIEEGVLISKKLKHIDKNKIVIYKYKLQKDTEGFYIINQREYSTLPDNIQDIKLSDLTIYTNNKLYDIRGIPQEEYRYDILTSKSYNIDELEKHLQTHPNVYKIKRIKDTLKVGVKMAFKIPFPHVMYPTKQEDPLNIYQFKL